jgi:hypothetical protein
MRGGTLMKERSAGAVGGQLASPLFRLGRVGSGGAEQHRAQGSPEEADRSGDQQRRVEAGGKGGVDRSLEGRRGGSSEFITREVGALPAVSSVETVPIARKVKLAGSTLQGELLPEPA